MIGADVIERGCPERTRRRPNLEAKAARDRNGALVDFHAKAAPAAMADASQVLSGPATEIEHTARRTQPGLWRPALEAEGPARQLLEQRCFPRQLVGVVLILRIEAEEFLCCGHRFEEQPATR